MTRVPHQSKKTETGESRGAPRILIAGPTASGKSALALNLAAALDAVILNADAMQVYRDLRLLTARPDSRDEARAPHRLYGVLDGEVRCSAGHFVRLAAEELGHWPDRPALIVGGTGLYFRALTEGLAEVPEISAAALDEAEAMLAARGREGMADWLAARDPATAAGIEAADPQRLVRAVSVLLGTGQGLAAWQANPARALIPAPDAAVVLEAERSWLHARAHARFDAMLQAGALGEVEALAARRLDPALPVMKAVGVGELTAYLAGESTLEEAVRDAKTATRRFIKRQDTWLRNQMGGWMRVPADDPEAACRMVLEAANL